MFNVLPDNLKKDIVRDYYKRLGVLVAFAVICIEIVGLVLLFPSYVAVWSQDKDVTAAHVSLSTTPMAQSVTDVSVKIHTINTVVDALTNTMQYPTVSPVISSLVGHAPHTIRLMEVSYSATDKTTADVVLHGIAADRESLVSFSRAVKLDPLVVGIDLPVSNFTKDKDLNFIATIHIDTRHAKK